MIVCTLLGICIIESLYFPFLRSPDTIIEWWQIGPLAGIGLVIGLPVLMTWEVFFKYEPFGESAYWLLTLVYVVGIYYVASKIILRFTNNRNQSINEDKL
jgi:uncharacterized membrane protein SirB2